MQVCCYTNLSPYTLYHKMGVCVYVKEAYKTEKYVYFLIKVRNVLSAISPATPISCLAKPQVKSKFNYVA